jgi:DNA-binding transcriptional regulator YhcF (GntR family)
VPRDCFGLSVSPDVRTSPLWGLSDRALRVYIVLAAHVTHVSRFQVVDGLKIPLEPGEVVMSVRTLRKMVRCSSGSLNEALKELRDGGIVGAEPQYRPARRRRRTLQESKRDTLQNMKRQRFGNRNGQQCVITRYKVHGLKTLPGMHNASKIEARSNREAMLPIRPQDERERARVERLLAEEGR